MIRQLGRWLVCMATVAMVTSENIRVPLQGDYFAPSYYPYGQPVQDNSNQFDVGQYDNGGSYAEYIPGVGSCNQYVSSFGIGSSSLSYIQDPEDDCRVYVCRNGRFLLTQSVNCPSDLTSLPGPYDQFGQSQGRPCAQCVGIQQQQQQPTDIGQQLQTGTSFENGAVFVNPLPVASNNTPPSGFSSVVTGARAPGGFALLVGATLQQCLDACLMASNCLAVDYDSLLRTCYVHGTTSYCNDVTSQTTSNHYKRVPCSAYNGGSTTGTGIRNQAVEIRTNYRVNPLAIGSSSPFCSRCRLVDCLTACYSYTICQGVDYDAVATSCYFLNSTNACSSLTPATNAIHISTVQCSPSPGSSTSSGGVAGVNALYNNFVAVKYLGPTSLPANWLGYPGSRVLGGTPIGSGISGDRCVALCQVHASCYSIDFNSIDGSCWAHTSELVKCGAPIPTNYIYHVKKPTACAFITGTYQAYPLPVSIGAAQL